MTSRSTSRSRKRIAGMCRALKFTFSTPGISRWTRLQMRSPHWSEASQETTMTQPASAPPAAAEDQAIRPFRISVPEAALVDLRQHIAATRWPDRETVTDQSRGVPLAKIQELVRYWGTNYDWRKAEAKLNALPQFVTTIDGLDIHFIHVRSTHPNAPPLIITHGWPGSIFE